MKKIYFMLLSALFLINCGGEKSTFLETTISIHDHQTSVNSLQKLIKVQGLTIFQTIDHQKNAKNVKMNLKPETLLVFGNPKMGTVLMNCNPSMGLDLPLRILISTNYEGVTSFTYTNPEYWSLKHNIKDKNCLSILNKAKFALNDLIKKVNKK